MRYSNEEDVLLIGLLPPNQEVKITILDLATDNKFSLVKDICTESKHIPGLYTFNKSNIIRPDLEPGSDKYNNVFFCMYIEGSEKKYFGKIVLGGVLDKKIEIDPNNLSTELNEIIEKLTVIQSLIV